MSLAFVFPGQGAQSIGMGRDLADAYPAAKAVFDEVDDALGEKLSTLIWEGEQDTLTLTENAQPALMATSIAALRALEAEGVAAARADYVAGHSLGEYSALAATGAISVADTARLLRLRGRCRRRFRSARARWRRFWGWISRRYRPWPQRLPRAKSARRQTTMTRRRWWYRGTKRRWNERRSLQRKKARNAHCYCRFPHRSIAA